jgi:hypothetical protein
MYNKNYLAKRPFLIVKNSYRPARGANTTVAGWGDLNGGQWSVFESINFVDRVKDKDMSTAVVIIDILEAKVIVNGFKDRNSNDDLLKHYLSKYKKQTTEAVGIWMENKARERALAGLPPEEMPFKVEAGSEDISAQNIESAFKQVAAEREAAIAKRAEELAAEVAEVAEAVGEPVAEKAVSADEEVKPKRKTKAKAE